MQIKVNDEVNKIVRAGKLSFLLGFFIWESGDTYIDRVRLNDQT